MRIKKKLFVGEMQVSECYSRWHL